MNRALIVIAMLVGIAGCGGVYVNGGPGIGPAIGFAKLEKISDDPKSGIVSYKHITKDDTVVNRKVARKKMEKFCAPQSYKIIEEMETDKDRERWSTTGTYVISDGTVRQRHTVIRFECCD